MIMSKKLKVIFNWSTINIGQRVLCPNSACMLPRKRGYVIGLVVEKINRPIRLLNIWQIHHEPKQMAGWFPVAELKPLEAL